MHAWRASVLTLPLCLLAAARASTPEAWAAHTQEVIAACVAASGLRKAHAAGDLVEFDDSVGFTAVLIAGRYPQPHMHDAAARVLCLFDKRSRRALVSGADAILRPQRVSPASPPQ
jgi:hypothetical protein